MNQRLPTPSRNRDKPLPKQRPKASSSTISKSKQEREASWGYLLARSFVCSLLTMTCLALVWLLLGSNLLINGIFAVDSRARGKAGADQEALGSGIDGERYRTACPDYKHYAVIPQYVPILPIGLRSVKGSRIVQPTTEQRSPSSTLPATFPPLSNLRLALGGGNH